MRYRECESICNRRTKSPGNPHAMHACCLHPTSRDDVVYSCKSSFQRCPFQPVEFLKARHCRRCLSGPHCARSAIWLSVGPWVSNHGMPAPRVPMLGQLQASGACTYIGSSMEMLCRQLRLEAILAATNGALCRLSPARLHRRPQSACSPAECGRHPFWSMPQNFACFEQEYMPPLGCSLDVHCSTYPHMSPSPGSHLLGECSLGAKQEKAISNLLSN